MYNYTVFSGLKKSTYYGIKRLEHDDLTKLQSTHCVAIAWLEVESTIELWIVQTELLNELRRFYRDTCSTRVVIDILERDNILCLEPKC